MAIVRLKIDKLLSELKITRYELSKRTGISYPTIDSYYKNKLVRYDSYVLEKICTALQCDIGDIIEYVKEEKL